MKNSLWNGMKIRFKQINFGRFFLLICSFVLSSCEKDSTEKKEVFKDVALGEFFTMEPGDIVRFQEPFDFLLTLNGFDDFSKQENTLATATANFDFVNSNASGGLILYVAQDQGAEGPISFFSGCSPSKIGYGLNTLIDVFYIIDEVMFKEDATKFSFTNIRLKIILKESDPNYFCVF